MKRNKSDNLMAVLLAAVVPVTALTATPMRTYAATPEFAYTAETWEKLRDNTLEYEELAGLVHEYNVTVINNWSDYQDQKNKDNDDIAQDYRDAADNIYDSIPDTTGVSEVLDASIEAAAAQMTASAKQMEKLAENNVYDSEIYRLQYQMTEESMVSTAQTLMITLENLQQNLKIMEETKVLLQAVYDSTVSRANVGMATQMDILTARENIQNMDSSISSMQDNIKATRQKLCMFTGWKYDATPEIKEVPSADVSRIDAMNPEADIQTALDNNFTIKINERKANNASSAVTIENTKLTIADGKQKVASAVNTQYMTVLQAKSAFDQSQAELATETARMATADRQYQIGTLSKLEYLQQQNTLVQKQIDVKLKDLELLQAMETYDWNVAGLASAS